MVIDEIEKLTDFFENNNFIVHPVEEDGIKCAELETWTKGGVNMIIWLKPFNSKEFEEYVESFDMDEEIDVHRQDQRYKDDFTISQSVKDFEDFTNRLKETVKKLSTIQKSRN